MSITAKFRMCYRRSVIMRPTIYLFIMVFVMSKTIIRSKKS